MVGQTGMDESLHWIEVPIQRSGVFGALVTCTEYFGYGMLTAVGALVAWFQMTGKFLEPPLRTHKPPNWWDGPAGLVVSLPIALLGSWLLLLRLLDMTIPATVFEGEATNLELKGSPSMHTSITDWIIHAGNQRWKLQAATVRMNLRKVITPGKIVRITYTVASRRILRLQVEGDG